MVEMIIWICALCGGLLLIMPWLDEMSKGYVRRYENALEEHLKTLISLTTGKDKDSSLRQFLILSLTAGLVAFVLLIGKVSNVLCLIATAFVTVLPYAALRVRLRFIQVESSREGEILITELLENYKINYCNMQRAIEVTAADLKEAPNSRRLLFSLSKGINSARSNEDLKRILDEFRLSINTSWAGILSVNMYFSLSSGMEVTHAMTDLSKSVAMARKVDEFVNRENNEAKLMLKYLAPISYLLTAVGGILFFNLSWKKFIIYQFRMSTGLTWFVISFLLYISGIVVYAYISRGKLDI